LTKINEPTGYVVNGQLGHVLNMGQFLILDQELKQLGLHQAQIRKFNKILNN